MEIVVAHFSSREFENLIDKFYNARIRIYDKSKVYSNPKYENVTILENQGREGDTYLYHIIENYDNLEEYTLFIQDDTDNHVESYSKFITETENVLRSSNKFFQYELSWRKNGKFSSNEIINGYNEKFDDDILSINIPLILLNFKLSEYEKEGLELFLKHHPDKFAIKHACEQFNITLPESYSSPNSAFFIVSKSTIHRRTKEFYINIRNWLLESEMNGFVLEMLWTLIFQ